MDFQIKQLLSNLLINSSLFVMLMIGIQNSETKQKVNFLINETIELPLSFIVGVSFISGSFLANILPLPNFSRK